MKPILNLFLCLAIAFGYSHSVLAQRYPVSSDRFEHSATRKVKSTTPKFAETQGLVSASPSMAYANLQKRVVSVDHEIQLLSQSLTSLKKSKAKKAVAQIESLQTERQVIMRQMDMYPRSITDPDYARELQAKEDALFKQQLATSASQMNSRVNPYGGQISSDPELQQAYKEYVDQNRLSDESDETYTDGQVVYRVMFAITKKPLSANTLSNMGAVSEQRMGDGKIAYYTGNYRTRSEAQSACNNILSNGRYRDAFVVAMVGNKRVPLR